MSEPSSNVPSSESIRNLDHASLKHARRQGAAWAIMFGAGENSFGLFGTFLQAPPLFFGLLTGIPQLVAPIMQVISANLMDSYPHRKKLVLMSVIGHVVCFVPLALLALAEPGWWTHAALLGVLAFYFISGHFGSPPWNSFMGDLVPSSRRGEIFAQIGRIAATLTLASMLATAFALYLGKAYVPDAMKWFFVGIFAVSGCSRFICFLCILRMREPRYVPRPESAFTFWQFIRRARESNFVKFVGFVSAFHCAANIANPYFLPYCRYDLKFDSWQWICINASAILATILSLMYWGRFADRFGTKRTLIYSSALIAIQPLWWLFSDNFIYLLVINLFSGTAWGGFNLAMSNYVMEACSPPVRARCFAYFTTLLGVGVFIGSMAGSLLIKTLPLHVELGSLFRHDFTSAFVYLLVISAFFRGLSALIFIPMFKELRQVHPFSFKEWFFENVESLYHIGISLVPFTGSDDADEDAPSEAGKNVGKGTKQDTACDEM